MATLDSMFGAPAGSKNPQPKDILPKESVSQSDTGGGSAQGRDVLLVASPFSSEAREFFNPDNEEVKAELAPKQSLDDALFGSPAGLVESAPLDPNVDPLLEALGPDIDDISRFGLPGAVTGGGDTDFNEAELRNQLRKILRRVS